MSKLLKITSGSEDVLLDDLYYKKGDTYTFNYNGSIRTSKTCQGLITTGAKECLISVNLKKRIPHDLTIKVTALSGIGRTINGYLEGSYQYIDFTNGYTISASSCTGDDTCVNIVITKSEAFVNATNNTPMVMSVSKLTITFS